jgi:hypothetical protein
MSAAALADVYEIKGSYTEARDVFRRSEKHAESVGDADFIQVAVLVYIIMRILFKRGHSLN